MPDRRDETEVTVMSAAARETSPFEEKIGRLVELSLGTGHDAYRDVPWDDPDYAVDPADPRLAAYPFDPLAHLPWYQALPSEAQARVGLQRTANAMRIGWEFENLLQQGLLIRAYAMRNDDAAFPYVHHEIMEESQHSMMFYEFVRRFAPEVHGIPRRLRRLLQPLVHFVSRRLPELFFIMVLAGEVPIDYVQRRAVRELELHPLVERILAIHIEEEARHVSYANHELRRQVPEMGLLGRHALALAIPVVLAVGARLIVYPSPWLLASHGVSREEARAAFSHPESRRVLAASVTRVRTLCRELRLLTPAAVMLWKAAGLWEQRETA